ncbi:probable purine permease 5 isoform X2 [Papaver somniferum]|uniref:probable purine permease 5 isoform X2 n=1 Tax=Papaver somniferum TaxID=3469 RepID=UPI000E6F7352|nr:probable purine permease 5 isoform X2 [Papaver somniferum]
MEMDPSLAPDHPQLSYSILPRHETKEDGSPEPSLSLLDQLSRFKTMACEAYTRKPASYWVLLVLSIGSMLVAFPASSLLSRLYFANGGKSKWIISWVSVAGWPLTALYLLPSYIFLKIQPTPLTFKLTLSYICFRVFKCCGYAYAYAYLPASTASLLASSSLVFSTIFGYFIVKNKIKVSTLNAIVIITAAVVLIGLDSDSDRFGNVSDSQYTLGFIWDIVGSALHGLIFADSYLRTQSWFL